MQALARPRAANSDSTTVSTPPAPEASNRGWRVPVVRSGNWSYGELRGATDRGLGLLIRRSDEAHLHERRRRRRRPGAVQSRAVAGPSTRGMHAKLLVQSWIVERVVVKRDAPVGKEFSDRGARDI